MAASPEAHLNGRGADDPGREGAVDRDRAAMRSRTRRDVAWLAAVAGLGAAWVGISVLLGAVTGRHQVDGIVGIVLGLYVSSFPARHFVDLLIYWKTELARFPTRRALGWWVALNGGVLVVGFVTIVYAAARFTAGGPR